MFDCRVRCNLTIKHMKENYYCFFNQYKKDVEISKLGLAVALATWYNKNIKCRW